MKPKAKRHVQLGLSIVMSLLISKDWKECAGAGVGVCVCAVASVFVSVFLLIALVKS